jgi:hypothetical protein
MIKRLEQIAALVVAAGLALVSYWLFFSWAQGGGVHRRQKPSSSSALPQLPLRTATVASTVASKPSAGFDQPLLGRTVVNGVDVLPHVFHRDGQIQVSAELDDPSEGTSRILEGLTEEGLGELGIFTDLGVERGGVGG